MKRTKRRVPHISILRCRHGAKARPLRQSQIEKNVRPYTLAGVPQASLLRPGFSKQHKSTGAPYFAVSSRRVGSKIYPSHLSRDSMRRTILLATLFLAPVLAAAQSQPRQIQQFTEGWRSSSPTRPAPNPPHSTTPPGNPSPSRMTGASPAPSTRTPPVAPPEASSPPASAGTAARSPCKNSIQRNASS
jgi:hypothetical protein